MLGPEINSPQPRLGGLQETPQFQRLDQNPLAPVMSPTYYPGDKEQQPAGESGLVAPPEAGATSDMQQVVTRYTELENTPDQTSRQTIAPAVGSAAVNPATEIRLKAEKPTSAEAINNIWMSRIARSEPNADNPLVVGFCQDAEGKIQTIYGPRVFESRREISSELAFLADMSTQKEVNLLETRAVPVGKPVVTKGASWDALPPELAQTFEEGKILVTTGTDHYAKAEDAAAPGETSDTARFSVLYYSDVSTPFGRTGVLMENRDGEWKPVTISADEKEYVVELKGCGTKHGGFGGEHFRTGRYVTTGGIDATLSDLEITNLDESAVEDGPKGVASITFENPAAPEGERQGYVVRLSPSTVRASFAGAEAYPDVSSPEVTKQVISMKAELLAEKMLGPNPTIIDRSGHSENILLWGDGKRTFTDYSDHTSLADPTLPTFTQGKDVLTPKKLVEYYAGMLSETPGFNVERDMPHFAATLKESFAQKGREITIDPSSSPAEIATQIWANGLAHQTYRTRVEKGYVAEQVVQDVCQVPENRVAPLGFNSEESFISTEARSRAEVQDIAQFVNRRRPAEADLLPVDAPIMTLIRALQSAPELSIGAMAKSDMTRDQQMAVFGKLETYANLHSQFIAPLEEYFAHEEDTLSTALQSCPEHEQQDIESALQVVRQRREEFSATVDERPGDFYKLVSSTQRLREFLTFDFYNRPRRQSTQK